MYRPRPHMHMHTHTDRAQGKQKPTSKGDSINSANVCETHTCMTSGVSGQDLLHLIILHTNAIILGCIVDVFSTHTDILLHNVLHIGSKTSTDIHSDWCSK